MRTLNVPTLKVRFSLCRTCCGEQQAMLNDVSRGLPIPIHRKVLPSTVPKAIVSVEGRAVSCSAGV